MGAVYRLAFRGPQSQVQYHEVLQPTLPGPQWVRVKTRYTYLWQRPEVDANRRA